MLLRHQFPKRSKKILLRLLARRGSVASYAVLYSERGKHHLVSGGAL